MHPIRRVFQAKEQVEVAFENKLKLLEEAANREHKEIEKGDGNIKLLLILYGQRQRKKGTNAV